MRNSRAFIPILLRITFLFVSLSSIDHLWRGWRTETSRQSPPVELQAACSAQTEFVICDDTIETCFENGKEMGMDRYEVRGFTAWYRFITLVMVVMAALAGICAAARASPVEQAYPPAMPSLRPLTIPEARHLLATLLWPLPRSAILILHWSWWRRCHQSRASFCHAKRR